jgi:hypothetical protein
VSESTQFDILGLIVKTETQLTDLAYTLKQVLQLLAQLEARVAALERRTGGGMVFEDTDTELAVDNTHRQEPVRWEFDKAEGE